MKYKRIVCMLLAFVAVFSAVSIPTFAAIPQESENISITATGRFSMDVPAGALGRASSGLPLEAGESVTINASYSPLSASVKIGLIASDGRFYGLPGSNGSFNETIVVEDRGTYYLAVINNSTTTVSVSGFVRY